MSSTHQDPLQIPVSNGESLVERVSELDFSALDLTKSDRSLLTKKLDALKNASSKDSLKDGEPINEIPAWRSSIVRPVALQLERIIGEDDRVRIESTNDYPYRAIAQLTLIARNGDRYLGTGWFIGPRILITAGHNLFNEQTGEWFEKLLVTPAKNGKLSLPKYGIIESRNFYSVKGWVEHKLPKYDYGCIVLPRQKMLGDIVGWFGFDVLSAEQLKNRVCRIAGYPGDKKGELAHTLWYDANLIKSSDRDTIHYLVDTYSGNSGSPVWIETEVGPIAVGIHNYDDISVNSATRINSDVAANMIFWNTLT